MNFPLLKKVKTLDELCSKHNCNFIQFENRVPFCPKCVKETNEKNNQAIVDRAFERITFKRLELDSIVTDESVWNASFSNYEESNEETKAAKYKARHFAKDYLDCDKKFNTIFSGVPGSGKTHLAMSMLKACNEYFNPHASCLFVDVNQLMLNIRASFTNPSLMGEYEYTHLLSKVELLVLDDLGSESCFRSKKQSEASEFVQRVLFTVLNARQRTIITTNLNSDDIRYIYNDKISSRMFKGSDGRIIEFTQKTTDKRAVSV